MTKDHIIALKTLPGLDLGVENHFISLDSGTDNVIKDSEIDFILSLAVQGIRNRKGKRIYEGSQLTWELKAGEMNMSLVDTLKSEFCEQLQKSDIEAKVSIKKHRSHKLDVWVVHRAVSALETDIQVNHIFRRMEERYPDLEMSLFMASEDELDGHKSLHFD